MPPVSLELAKFYSLSDGDYMVEIPVWEKYVLLIEEAAAYFRIGENKLRRICEDAYNQDFVLRNGNRLEIKRIAFEKWLDKVNDV